MSLSFRPDPGKQVELQKSRGEVVIDEVIQIRQEKTLILNPNICTVYVHSISVYWPLSEMKATPAVVPSSKYKLH